MTDPIMVHGANMVMCDFCTRWEDDSPGNWNVYKGYGFAMSTFGRKKLVVPWVLDKAQTRVEHHRVCGATRYPGNLFIPMSLHSGFRCSSCGKVYAYYDVGTGTASSSLRDFYWRRARDCCGNQSKLKTTEM